MSPFEPQYAAQKEMFIGGLLRVLFKRREAPGLAVKRSFDLVSAGSVLVVLMPLLIIVAALLLVSQGRPILIKHKRLGRNGRMFPCLKFRTMVNNSAQVLDEVLQKDLTAAEEWRRTRKLREDPRITPVGRVLRKSSVDELPQLINILLGHMSVVGPRPIVEDEIAFYGNHITDYYKVRPGLTGLWQVSGRSDTSYAHRVGLDCKYSRSVSLAGDLKIIVKTVPAVLRSQGSY